MVGVSLTGDIRMRSFVAQGARRVGPTFHADKVPFLRWNTFDPLLLAVSRFFSLWCGRLLPHVDLWCDRPLEGQLQLEGASLSNRTSDHFQCNGLPAGGAGVLVN